MITSLWIELGEGYLVRQYLTEYRLSLATYSPKHKDVDALFGEAYWLRWKIAKSR